MRVERGFTLPQGKQREKGTAGTQEHIGRREMVMKETAG